jgi:hypothetical protein
MSRLVLLSITNPFPRHATIESELSQIRLIIPSIVTIAIGQHACFASVENAY